MKRFLWLHHQPRIIFSFCNSLLPLLELNRGRRRAAVESAAVTKSELSASAGKDDDEDEDEEVLWCFR